MSRIEQLVRPGRRTGGGSVIFPLLGIAAAFVAFYAHAQIAASKPADITSKPPVTVAQTTSLHVGKPPQDAYALVRKGSDGVTMSGSTDDLRAIKSAQRSMNGDFVWFRRNDKAYVITDPAFVARAEQAWRESNKLGSQMETLGDQMEVHGAKMEALGAQMEKLSAGHEKSATMEAASKRMEVLAKQQQALAAQQSQLAAKMVSGSEAQREQLERQMDALSEQQDALADQMDQQADVMDAESERMEARMQPMEALGRQMDEAAKPMEALGEQMDALGEQQEKLVAQAEREMQKLIGEAMNKGVAIPAPGPTKQ
jgi:chromosome segregation ATPase